MPSRKKVIILHPISLHVIGRKWAPHESIFPQNTSESAHFTDKADLFLFHLKILLSHKMPNRKKVISGDAPPLCFSLCTPPEDNSLWHILINSGSFGTDRLKLFGSFRWPNRKNPMKNADLDFGPIQVFRSRFRPSPSNRLKRPDFG